VTLSLTVFQHARSRLPRAAASTVVGDIVEFGGRRRRSQLSHRRRSSWRRRLQQWSWRRRGTTVHCDSA